MYVHQYKFIVSSLFSIMYPNIIYYSFIHIYSNICISILWYIYIYIFIGSIYLLILIKKNYFVRHVMQKYIYTLWVIIILICV